MSYPICIFLSVKKRRINIKKILAGKSKINLSLLVACTAVHSGAGVSFLAHLSQSELL